ncbi:ComF family protein [Marinobacter sp. X15-166B]|uniref:ComF family protein n=1 Tax=Marinobacter sp. X15-166B TaxID=1897620 RepID=UPI001D17953E|nr:ComF family protein [Marinobacter sp. X15-166B]
MPLNRQSCRQCALPLPTAAADLRCGECLRDPPHFQRALAPWCYQFPVDRLISHYKYQRQYACGRPLIDGLVQHLHDQGCFTPPRRPELIIPSPMHPDKRRQRGFNQAEDMAERVSRCAGIPWSVNVLQRIRRTAPQSGLDRHQRLTNLSNLYRVTGAVPARVAIVDDVVTTGATARAMASALRRAGARNIEIWALARTPAPVARPRD